MSVITWRTGVITRRNSDQLLLVLFVAEKKVEWPEKGKNRHSQADRASFTLNTSDQAMVGLVIVIIALLPQWVEKQLI